MWRNKFFVMDAATDGTGGAAAGGAAANTPAAGAAAGGAAATTDWATSISDEGTRSWVQAKGFKDVGSLAQSALNLEKLTGDLNAIVKVPKDNNPESWGPVYDRLGRPKDAADYQLPMREGDKTDFNKTAASWMHEAGLNTNQAKLLATKFNEHIGGLEKTNNNAIEEKSAADMALLKGEWKTDFDGNVALAKRAALEMGLTPELADKLETLHGTSGLLKLFHKIGTKLGSEGTLIGNDGKGNGGGATTQQQALAQIATNQKDTSFAARFNSKDDVVRGEARKEMERLHKIAYPGETSF